ncbi:hypothetical protein Q0590_12160 [Rhodocytophaga aerolata]|uniref:DUF4305 domain-containing protein n=1 Tax=Rhodocytophaga aerolata TaxID=455078 RepID=A0ABT8R756_9BACT|nr:hypothetical protein [Rhodocytophaga aerolata]MDO1447013.1 hypothetical protein [Rhodocytophaga aerolata]
MSVSFACIAPVFDKNSLLEKSIRWMFIIGVLFTIVALAIISFIYGINREYRFEVAVITIDYVVLLINGILLATLFRKYRKAE